MLVMTRKAHESVILGNSGLLRGVLKVTVIETNGTEVKLAFEVDSDGREAAKAPPGACRVCQSRAGYLIVDDEHKADR